MVNPKVSVLLALKNYFNAISNTPPPLTVARSLVIGDAVRAISSGNDPPLVYTMNETLGILEDRLRDTPSIAEELIAPEPEIWVHDNLATIWTGSQQVLDGEVARKGVHTFSLLRGQDHVWRIAGVATTARLPTEEVPPITEDPETEIGSTLLDFVHHTFAALNRADLDAFAESLHPLMGAVVALGSGAPAVVRREVYIQELKRNFSHLPHGAKLEKVIFDVRLLVGGDLGNVWAPYRLLRNGAVKSHGVIALRLFKQSGRWTIVGICDTSESTS